MCALLSKKHTATFCRYPLFNKDVLEEETETWQELLYSQMTKTPRATKVLQLRFYILFKNITWDKHDKIKLFS